MKQTTLFLILLSIAAFAKGQTAITLSQSNMTAIKPGPVNVHVVNPATLSNPTTGSNQTWNFSSVFGGPVHSVNLLAASAFSASAVEDTSSIEIISSNFGLKSFFVYDMDANGYFFSGAQIPKQAYTLGSVTGNTADSILIPAQTYKLRQDFISFPATSGSTWTSKTKHSLNFYINSPANFLFNAKASKLSHTTVVDSVMGWGTISIPSSDKGSIPYPVLMVKEHTSTIDSFFLGGSPAPAPLLNSFGIVQGTLSSNYTIHFYRAGAPISFMTINYDTDYTYKNPASGTYTADNVESGIDNMISGISQFNVFPNPSESGIYNCSFNKTSGAPWQMEVVNMMGKKITSQTIEAEGNVNIKLNLSANSSGLYFINILDEKGVPVASGKLSLVKP